MSCVDLVAVKGGGKLQLHGTKTSYNENTCKYHHLGQNN